MIFYSLEKREAFLAQIGPGAYNKEVNQKVNSDLTRFDLNPEIRKFRFPVLVITGRYDMNVAPLVAYRIHQAIPGSGFAVFEKSSHLPFTEEPEAFAKTVEEFLQASSSSFGFFSPCTLRSGVRVLCVSAFSAVHEGDHKRAATRAAMRPSCVRSTRTRLSVSGTPSLGTKY